MSHAHESYAADLVNEAVKQEALASVVARAGRDGVFRAALLADPFAALNVPRPGVADGAQFPVRFVEAGPEQAAGDDRRPTVVLPTLAPSDELAEQELEAVAGGASLSDWGKALLVVASAMFGGGE